MNFLQAIILSIIEGITEFLPISSTGHLILTSRILGIAQTEFVKSFEIAIQLGAIFSVIFLYHNSLFRFPPPRWKPVFVGFLPTAALGFTFYSSVKGVLLGNTQVVLWTLLLGGIVLVCFEKIFKGMAAGQRRAEDMSVAQALIVGLFQSVSMIPGVSRAASTIIGGLFVGLDRKSAVEFSFLLAVPTMIAATSLDLFKTRFLFTFEEYLLLIVGFLGAFVTALATIKFFLSYIQNHTFVAFGIYRIVVAILFLLLVP